MYAPSLVVFYDARSLPVWMTPMELFAASHTTVACQGTTTAINVVPAGTLASLRLVLEWLMKCG